MRIISIMNQKGGCGKTTTAINLSAFLTEFNKKTLLIDLDPQGHATSGFNIQEDTIEADLFDVFTKKASLNDIIIRGVFKGMDLAPTTLRLSAIEQYLAGTIGRERQLRSHIEKDKHSFNYDYIIIDCPPQLGLLGFNALVASNEVIVPIEPSSFSLQGTERLLETIDLLRENVSHHPLKIMVLPTLYSHQNLFSREILKKIREKFEPGVLKTVIRQNVRLKEAVQKGCPVFIYDPRSIGAEDYQNLTMEIIQQEKSEPAWTDMKFSDNTGVASMAAEQARKNAVNLVADIASFLIK
ncbi:MAG TPA: ParA family protein [Nitrospiria bacterium]|nr:ParA family protein [Nitrospiria bacterium]